MQMESSSETEGTEPGGAISVPWESKLTPLTRSDI